MEREKLLAMGAGVCQEIPSCWFWQGSATKRSWIGDTIEVTVVDIRGDKVRLGISAPRDVSVHRKEVYDAIRRENQASANLPAGRSGRRKFPSRADHAITSAGACSRRGRPSRAVYYAAIDEAKKGLEEGGLPIGSVLVRDGQIISRGHNRRVQNGDPWPTRKSTA